MRVFVAGAGAYVRRGTVALAVAAAVAGCGADLTAPFSGSEPVSVPVEFDPLTYDEGFDAEYEGRAAAGESHVLYARSPGGVAATARRVERLRALVESAAGEGDVDPDLLEAMVFLESAGRPDVIAGDDPEAASGLTQILAETGQGLLGMRIDLAASRRLTRALPARAAPRPSGGRRPGRWPPGAGWTSASSPPARWLAPCATWRSRARAWAATTSRSSPTTWASAT